LTEPKLLFRVDANIDTGTGHFFRCLAIALAAKKRGFKSLFVGDIQSLYLNEMLEKNGFRYLSFLADKSNIEIDAKHFLQIAHEEKIRAVIVDDKILDFEWEGLIRQHVQVLAVIDDRPNRKHEVDILISPNIYKAGEKPFEGFVPIECEIFLGPSSLPLRPEFRITSAKRALGKPVTRVGSFFGGTDPGNQSGLILQLAKLPQYSNIKFEVITGPLNPMNVELFQSAENIHNVKIRTTVTDMAKFWDGVDVAFGSYGISTWERCALGVPTITSIQNSEQESAADLLSFEEAVIDVGNIEVLSIEKLAGALDFLIIHPLERAKICINSKKIMADSFLRSDACLESILRQ